MSRLVSIVSRTVLPGRHSPLVRQVPSALSSRKQVPSARQPNWPNAEPNLIDLDESMARRSSRDRSAGATFLGAKTTPT